ncbi:MAG: MFS transporter [Dehalococcoidales bacterium]|nr:MFS transporter [Dehalococcoidales bacterium]
MWFSQAFSLIGTMVVEFALAWYLTRETGSATVLATAMLVALIPQIVLGPFIGPLVDRWNRKKIMIFADLSIAVVTLGLVLLFLTDTIQIWHIYVAMVLRSIGQTFHFPAVLASVATIVPEKHLTRAAGLNQMLQGVVSIAAPPLGALLMEALPMQGVLAVDIGTAIIAVGFILPLTIPRPARTTLVEKASIIGDMVQGFRYLMARRGLTMLMWLFALLGFFTGPAVSLFPMLVNLNLGGDVLKLGWLSAVMGIGNITAGVLLGIWGGFKKRIYMLLLGLLLIGITNVGLGFTSESVFYFILVDSFILGVGITMTDAPFLAIMNSIVAKDMQGRVFTLINSLSGLMIPIGLAIAGPAADFLGIEWIYFICGGAFLIITLLAFSSKPLMELEEHKAEDKPNESVAAT